MYQKYLKTIVNSQTGYASFVITLITIIVVSLIVVAFATDSRLGQKNSLANVLSTQAYYAAESGINDAYAIIQHDVSSGGTISSTGGQCAQSPSPYISSTPNSSSLYNNGQIGYNCLIVNTAPNSLNYQDVIPGQGEVIKLNSANSHRIKKLIVSWQYYSSAGSSSPNFLSCPSSFSLPPLSPPSFSSSNCSASVLQLDIVSKNSLLATSSASASTVFLEPITAGGVYSTPPLPPNTVKTYGVNCSVTNKPYACKVAIALSNNHKTFYLHLQTFYMPSSINISAQSSSGQLIPLSDAQVLIDSTGYASGQLKRLEERVCYGNYCGNYAPVGAIQSNNCINKHFGVYPGASTTPSSSC
jgi:hypothetical protein